MPGLKFKPIPEFTPVTLEKFKRNIPQNLPDDVCWPWQGHTVYGYGQFSVYPWGSFRAHRIAYKLAKGDIGQLNVLHRCDNPPCCNPSHLFLGTTADNVADKIKKGRLRAYKGPRPNQWGTKHHKAKLTDAAVVAIRQRWNDGATVKQLSREFSISTTNAHRVATGKGWKHIKSHATEGTTH